MLSRLRISALVICSSLLLACNSVEQGNTMQQKQDIYQLKHLIQASEKRIVVNVNDKVIINSNPKQSEWWVLYPDKNAASQLEINKHSNNKQHSLTFTKQGEFGVTGVKKSTSGQMASISRNLTFVVN